MSIDGGPTPSRRQAGAAAHRGRDRDVAASVPDRPPLWSCRHGHGAGAFDETARRASHQELEVARVLVSEGHDVRTVAERRAVRTPDLVACGTSVEVKSFQSLAERAGRAPSAEGVANKLLDARGQGSVAFIWAAGSGLTGATAVAGYGMFCGRAVQEGAGRVRAARIMGDGFDLSFAVEADLRLAKRASGPSPRARPQMSL